MRAALGLGRGVSDAAVVDAYVTSLGFGITVEPAAPTPPDPFASAAAMLFRAPGSVAAIFTPTGGSPIPTRIIRGQPDAASRFGGGSIVQPTNVFQMLRAEVASPAAGDGLLVGADALVITGVPTLDIERVTWICAADPA